MFRSFSIGSRIIALVVFMILFIAGVVLAFLATTEQVKHMGSRETQRVMLAEQKDKLQVATRSLALSLGELLPLLPGDDAKVAAIRGAVDPIRYEADKSGYFFVYQGTVNVALPTKKETQGKDLSGAKDKNGVYFVRELAAKAQSGGGFVQYVFDKPGKGDQPKLAYAELIPGTNYWIGTGIYIDNIEEASASIERTIGAFVSTAVAWRIGIITALLLLVVAPVCVLVITGIVRPLRAATEAAGQVAAGNLNISISAQGRDEVAALQHALDTMVRTLRDNIESIRAKEAEANRQTAAAQEAARAAEDARARAATATREGMLAAAQQLEDVVAGITSASNDLTTDAHEIDHGTSLQLARISETATAMEQMNATVLEVARNATRAAEQTEFSRVKAQEGSSMVQRTVDAMNQLHTLAADLKSNMHRLGTQSEAIGQIMNVINDIADQTNLLALNAAIEAARAGEAGRGFAVVADEVRKLAEKTMGATKEVGDSIRAIQDLARQNVSGMDAATTAIQGAAELSTTSGTLLGEILDVAGDAAGQVQAIATAAEQQSAASEQITHSVEDINSIARENEQRVARTNEHIREVTEQATTLSHIVETLKQG